MMLHQYDVILIIFSSQKHNEGDIKTFLTIKYFIYNDLMINKHKYKEHKL